MQIKKKGFPKILPKDFQFLPCNFEYNFFIKRKSIDQIINPQSLGEYNQQEFLKIYQINPNYPLNDRKSFDWRFSLIYFPQLRGNPSMKVSKTNQWFQLKNI